MALLSHQDLIYLLALLMALCLRYKFERICLEKTQGVQNAFWDGCWGRLQWSFICLLAQSDCCAVIVGRESSQSTWFIPPVTVGYICFSREQIAIFFSLLEKFTQRWAITPNRHNISSLKNLQKKSMVYFISIVFPKFPHTFALPGLDNLRATTLHNKMLAHKHGLGLETLM